MNLQEIKSGIRIELDMLGDEAAKLKDHLNDGFAENFSEAKNAAQSGIDHIQGAAGLVAGEAEALRARVNEELQEAKKYVDERFGGRTLANPEDD
jgi:predicted TIM-barrel enzyme